MNELSDYEISHSLQHVHVHIMPRKPGDFEENDDIYYEVSDIMRVTVKIVYND